ncbi:MAG: HEAT repeat domain-containing protein [Bacteroidota bacterium]
MKKQEYQELLSRSVFDELTADEHQKLKSYLKTHPALKREHRELQRLRDIMSSPVADINIDGLLADARMALRHDIRKERKTETAAVMVLQSIRELFSPKFALAGAAVLVLGIAIGYYVFSPLSDRQDMVMLPVSGNTSTSKNMHINNVRMIETGNGTVEIEFDAVAPISIKGNINDPDIQKVLTYALLNESNAGIRLASVNTIGDQINQRSMPDPAVRRALITTVTSDENPGVRREALRVLLQFGYDDAIRDALLSILSNDQNTGMRVAAINALETARLDGRKFDEPTIDILKKSMETENNRYIRNRAATFVKEIYQ